MPRLLSVYSIPDQGWSEEPVFFVAGFPVKARLLVFLLATVLGFAARLPLLLVAVVAAAGLVLGLVPFRIPPARLFARRTPPPEDLFASIPGVLLVYVNSRGRVIVSIDGEEAVVEGFGRIEAVLGPGEHVVEYKGALEKTVRVHVGEKLETGTPG